MRCLEPYDPMYLDRLLWCDRCKATARNRASWWGWGAGLLFAAGVATYVWTAIRPTDLVIGGWVATVAAAAWIGQKVAREIVYGGMRLRNEEAVEGGSPTDEPARPA
jgi:hypothetical protein